MPFDLSKILDAVKLGPRILVAVIAASSLLLFAPRALLDRLGLSELPKTYLPWIGVIWLAAVSLTVAHLLAAKTLRDALVLRFIYHRRWKHRLRHLTFEERDFLAHYLLKASRTQNAAYNDGLVNELVASQIIRRASDVSGHFLDFPYNIQPWAWNELHKHPELLGLRPEQIGSDRKVS